MENRDTRQYLNLFKSSRNRIQEATDEAATYLRIYKECVAQTQEFASLQRKARFMLVNNDTFLSAIEFFEKENRIRERLRISQAKIQQKLSASLAYLLEILRSVLSVENIDTQFEHYVHLRIRNRLKSIIAVVGELSDSGFDYSPIISLAIQGRTLCILYAGLSEEMVKTRHYYRELVSVLEV